MNKLTGGQEMGHRDYIDIIELMEILNVPEIERHLYYAIQNCKTGEYADKLKIFKEKKKALRQALFESFYPGNNKSSKEIHSPLYWFEVIRYSKGYWEIKVLEPTPPPYFETSEIIPGDIIQLIVAYPVNPDRVERLTNVSSHLYAKNYDLQFTRLSRYMVCGTINENQQAREQRVKSQIFTWSEQLEVAYKVMFYYMEKFPMLRSYLFNEFFSILKPAIDERQDEKV